MRRQRKENYTVKVHGWNEAISFQLSVNTEDPDLTKVQLKLVQGAEAHAQGGFRRQGDGVRINHGP